MQSLKLLKKQTKREREREDQAQRKAKKKLFLYVFLWTILLSTDKGEEFGFMTITFPWIQWTNKGGHLQYIKKPILVLMMCPAKANLQ